MIMKNRFMRAAMLLLALVLISTCAVGGTFAKYQTVESSADSARVAKWGVEINPNGNLFNGYYKDSAVEATDTSATVKVEGEGKIVAPGTNGTLTAMSLTGKPEVSFKVEYDATLTLENWTLENGTVYCPIVINVNGTDYKIGENNIADIAGLQSAVETAIESKTAEYGPNTDLSSAALPSVSWSWAIGDANASDTYLGDLAADADTTNDSTIKLEITTTITQID